MALLFALLVPFAFYKVSCFLGHAFLKDTGSWHKWKMVIRINLAVVLIAYLIGVGIFARGLFNHISDTHEPANFKRSAKLTNSPEYPSPPRQWEEPDKPLKEEARRVLRPVVPPFGGIISLARGPRFGVNWDEVNEGLLITRLGSGPMKDAGLEPGDLIIRLDGTPIVGEKRLLETRNKIYANQIPNAHLLVQRGDQKYTYRMER